MKRGTDLCFSSLIITLTFAIELYSSTTAAKWIPWWTLGSAISLWYFVFAAFSFPSSCKAASVILVPDCRGASDLVLLLQSLFASLISDACSWAAGWVLKSWDCGSRVLCSCCHCIALGVRLMMSAHLNSPWTTFRPCMMISERFLRSLADKTGDPTTELLWAMRAKHQVMTSVAESSYRAISALNTVLTASRNWLLTQLDLSRLRSTIAVWKDARPASERPQEKI